MSKRTEGFICVGRRGDEYYFIDSIFDHGNGLCGCTGSIVRPVSVKEYEYATDRENVAQRLSESYPGEVDSGGFERYVDNVIQYDGADTVMFDDSYCCDASDAFDAMGIEYECTDCTGCGRLFGDGSSYDEVFDYKALEACEAFDLGAGSYEYAAQIIFGKIA